MTEQDDILKRFDEYFLNTPKAEIDNTVAIVNSLGFEGISVDDYFDQLNSSTSFDIINEEMCADMELTPFYNKMFLLVSMGTALVTTLTPVVLKNQTIENPFLIAA